jgi:UDP-galactopyranose mutase
MKTALILGGGFAGCTAANMLKQRGFNITIVEKSGVLGGGCRTFFYHGHPFTWGPHHFLADVGDTKIWDYLASYVNLRVLEHFNMTFVAKDNAFYTYPIHQDEIAQMPDQEKITQELLSRSDVSRAGDFEEYWVSSVGQTLYEKFINTYSKKMWKIPNNKILDEFTFSPKGVALGTGSKACFGGKKVVGYPTELDGYNSYFEKCVEGCHVIYNVEIDKFDIEHRKVLVQDQWLTADLIISTLSPDMIFDYKYGELPYIGRDFLKIILPTERVTPEPYYYIHYANDEPFTRIFEYKLLTGYKSPHTLLIVETPSMANKLYPYPIMAEINKAQRYLRELPRDFYSLGRMGKYHYDNMDVVIKDCFALMEKI